MFSSLWSSRKCWRCCQDWAERKYEYRNNYWTVPLPKIEWPWKMLGEERSLKWLVRTDLIPSPDHTINSITTKNVSIVKIVLKEEENQCHELQWCVIFHSVIIFSFSPPLLSPFVKCFFLTEASIAWEKRVFSTNSFSSKFNCCLKKQGLRSETQRQCGLLWGSAYQSQVVYSWYEQNWLLGFLKTETATPWMEMEIEICKMYEPSAFLKKAVTNL